jgi:hypothetical protein
MKFISYVLASLILFLNSASAQNSADKKAELTYKFLNQKQTSDLNFQDNLTDLQATSEKSSGLAMIMSLVLPGAGHFYIDRMDVGKYFVAGEAASWIGFAGFNIFGDAIRSDSRSYAHQIAGANKNISDDEYYTNIGFYMNIYDYNNDKLARGEYDQLYDVNKFYWYWNSAEEQGTFETQRKKSERMYNKRVIFTTAMIVNRITSAISALILANQQNTLLRNTQLKSELIKGANNTFDGLSLNFIKNF